MNHRFFCPESFNNYVGAIFFPRVFDMNNRVANLPNRIPLTILWRELLADPPYDPFELFPHGNQPPTPIVINPQRPEPWNSTH